MADEAKIIVNGKEYPLPTSYTLGEEADMEKITGQGYDLAQGGPLGLLAIMFVAIHRADPTVTVDDIRALSGDELDIQTSGEVVPPPSGDASNEVAPPSTDSSAPGSGLHPVRTHASSGTAA
jgi:hypothetical protein